MDIFLHIIIMLTILLSLLVILFFVNDKKPSSKKVGGPCDIVSCGALDPVSNPAYNFQQIVKQSILLEEHITNKNKRCRDCITKHFLHLFMKSKMFFIYLNTLI